jgi:hypothetical protein
MGEGIGRATFRHEQTAVPKRSFRRASVADFR